MPKSSRSHRNAADISRRQLLAGASAGAAALFLERGGLHAQAPAGSTVVFSHTTVVNVDAVQNDVALAVEGDKIAAIGPTDQILQRYPRAEVYDGRGKALFPGLDQLPRAPGGDARAWLQRGLRVPELREAVGPARQPASGRRGHADGDDRCARSAPHRHHHDCREHRRHRPLRRGAGEDRAALRVRRVGARQRERSGPDVARGAGEKRDAEVFSEAARRRHAANRRPVQQVARREPGTHHRLPRRGARRDRVARTA